jgi:hypothetical protein
MKKNKKDMEPAWTQKDLLAIVAMKNHIARWNSDNNPPIVVPNGLFTYDKKENVYKNADGNILTIEDLGG